MPTQWCSCMSFEISFRFFSERVFESLKSWTPTSERKATAEAKTGPAKQPRPTSSTPMMIEFELTGSDYSAAEVEVSSFLEASEVVATRSESILAALPSSERR